MIFCLFDKFDRGYKGLHVLNVQKQSFRCKFEFEISGVHYFIEREGNTTRTGNVKVDVFFWKMVNGVKEELHGNARRNTNDIIRDYIGTYEDFIITAASFQTAKNLTSFIDMGNSERKDLLVQYIGLNVFDRLHDPRRVFRYLNPRRNRNAMATWPPNAIPIPKLPGRVQLPRTPIMRALRQRAKPPRLARLGKADV